jgi:hypothetical protein
MNPAKTQVAAQKLVARAMAEAEAGKLDPRIHRALERTFVIRKPLQRPRSTH